MSANPLAPPWLALPPDANALPAAVWSQNARRIASGELEIAGVSASAIAAEFGTPVYVVDQADVVARATAIREHFERAFDAVGAQIRVYYAGQGVPQHRGGEMDGGGRPEHSTSPRVARLAVALAAGIDPWRLGLHGNNKSDAELDRAIAARIGTIVLDSAAEVDRGRRQSRAGMVCGSACGLINSGVHASTHEYPGHRPRGPEVRRSDRRCSRAGCDDPRASRTGVRRPPLAHRLADLRVRRVRGSRAPVVRTSRRAARGWPGARAQPGRRLRHRVHRGRRAAVDRAARERVRGGRRPQPRPRRAFRCRSSRSSPDVR